MPQRATSGVAAIEFGFMLPILMTAGMYGTELAYMGTINMRISQLALEVGDNAARMEQTNNSSVAPTVTEADINQVMTGAQKEGLSFNFNPNGKVILTSLEKDPSTGKQFIHWQRCTGSLVRASAYGNNTTQNGLNGAALTGMGQSGAQITAPSNLAVMYVEVFYQYTPLFGNLFVGTKQFKQEAAFIVRDIRDLQNASSPKGTGITGTGSTSICT